MDEFKQKQLNKQKMVCTKCFFIYTPEYGDPESNVEPYTNFVDLPEEWGCPICEGDKSNFTPLTEEMIYNTVGKDTEK